MFLRHKKLELPTPDEALPGRSTEMPVAGPHTVLGTPLHGPWPAGHEVGGLRDGLFLGRRADLLALPGVYSTAVGYAGGITPEPDVRGDLLRHDRARRGRPGRVRPGARSATSSCSRSFWENHDPTQGMRQGNDVGTQYRSAIYTTTDEQFATAQASREAFAAGGQARRARRDHHGDRAAGGLLLRRGLPPAVPSSSSRTATATTARTA